MRRCVPDVDRTTLVNETLVDTCTSNTSPLFSESATFSHVRVGVLSESWALVVGEYKDGTGSGLLSGAANTVIRAFFELSPSSLSC